MAKFLKHLAKDSVKFKADFVANELSLISEEDCYIRVDIQRGKKKTSSLAPLLIRSSGMTRDEQRMRFPANKSELSCTFFIKNGEPEVKKASITIYICDKKGKGTFLGAQGEFNIARHFGAEYQNGLQTLKTAPGAQARGFSFQSLSYSVVLEPTKKKDKQIAAMNELVQWRQKEQRAEQFQAEQQQNDRREEELRREAHRVEKERQAAELGGQESVRGFASFKDNVGQKRTQSMVQDTDQQPGINTFPTPAYATNEQRTQSMGMARKKKGVVFNRQTAGNMMKDITELDEDDDTISTRRSAERHDLRASNRSAVKGDLRNQTNLSLLEPMDEEILDNDKNGDRFEHLLRDSNNREENKLENLEGNLKSGHRSEAVDQQKMDIAAAAAFEEEERKKRLASEAAAMHAAEEVARHAAEQEQKRLVEEETAKHAVQEAAREEEEMAHKDVEIADLQKQITALQEEFAAKAKAEDHKHDMAMQLQALEAEIEQQSRDAEYVQQMQAEEKYELQAELEHLQNEQADDMTKKLFKADHELQTAGDELNEADIERKVLTQQMIDNQQKFEEYSNDHSQYVKEIGELLEAQQEQSNELSETIHSCSQRKEQILATETFIDSMETESERNVVMIQEAEHTSSMVYRQEIAQLRADTTQLRKDRGHMENQKLHMQSEAAEMKEKIAKLEEETNVDETRLQEIGEKVEHAEKEIIAANDEKLMIERAIAEKVARNVKRQSEKDQLKRLKTQMLTKKAERKKKLEAKERQQKEAKEQEELEAKIQAERIRAAAALQTQFNKANESMFSDALEQSVDISAQESNESVIEHDRSLLMNELEQNMTPRGTHVGFFKEGAPNKRGSIFQPENNLSFYSQRSEEDFSNGSFHQSFVQHESEDGEQHPDQSFDALMEQKGNLGFERYNQSFKSISNASEYNNNRDNSFQEQNQSYSKLSIASNQRPVMMAEPNDKAAVVFYTPNKETDIHFETQDSEGVPIQTELLEKTDSLSDDKSLTEPALDSNGHPFSESQNNHTSMKKSQKDYSDAEWLKYNEQESQSPLKLQHDYKVEKDEDHNEEPITFAIEMDKLSDKNSAYDSFHSDDFEDKTTPDEVKDTQGDQKFQRKLTVIREESSDRLMDGMESEDEEIIKVESPKESIEPESMLTEFQIRQKVLMATSPRSKAQAIKELEEDLKTINIEIMDIQRGKKMSLAEYNAKIEEKYRIRDIIESCLEALDEPLTHPKPIAKNKLAFKNLAAVETMDEHHDEADPYAPSAASSFIDSGANNQQHEFRPSLLDRSRFSSFSSSRGSVRGSVYSSTAYDRQRSANLKSKSRRQVFTEMAMRDMFFMLVTSKTFYTAMSDFELITGFNQFQSMLEMDKSCHEAMYGLGKVNFFVKRYELAERWFMQAYKAKHDKVYRAWLGFTYMKLSQQVLPDSPNRMEYLKYAVKNLTACVKDDDLATYCITALLFLSVDLQKEIPNQPEVPGLKEPSKYLQGLKTCYDMKPGDSYVEMTLAQAYIDLNTPGRISQGVSALTQCITVSSARPEPYLMLSQHYADQKQMHEERRTLDQAIKKATDFQSYPERLLLILTHTRSLRKSKDTKDHLEACKLLQMQHTRTPHYASAILYQYGKTIIKSEMSALLPSAISALEEVQRCSTSLRVQSCYAYLARAFQLLQHYPMYASLYAQQYQSSSKELTDRVIGVKTAPKTQMVTEILANILSRHQTMFQVLNGVKAAVEFDQKTAMERGSHVLTMSFIEGSRSSVRQINGKTISRMNMLTTPLERLVETSDAPPSSGGNIEDLLELTKQLPEQRDQMISQGLILRSLQDSSVDAHKKLFSELLQQRDQITERQDIQLQTLLVRCYRKSKLYDTKQVDEEPLTIAFSLIDMLRHIQSSGVMQGSSPPLTTVVYIDAHLESAKLLFALSKLEAQVQELSSGTIFQMAIHILLSAIPVLPQVDFKLGNPQLPIETEDYEFQDLEMIDFTLGADPLAFAKKLEQLSEQTSEGQSFSQSTLVQTKIRDDQLMLQGSISIDTHKTANEVDEDETAMFSFPESLTRNSDEPKAANNRWSATSMAAITTFLESEGTISVDKSNDLNAKVTQLSQFHVHSSPELFKNIGKMCLKAGKYADLAIIALKEYLVTVTYQKMFTMAAGQGLNDEASMQSGYSLIRHDTMLCLAEGLQLLSTEAQGERKNTMLQDANTLLTKVTKSRHATQLQLRIKELSKTLK